LEGGFFPPLGKNPRREGGYFTQGGGERPLATKTYIFTPRRKECSPVERHGKKREVPVFSDKGWGLREIKKKRGGGTTNPTKKKKKKKPCHFLKLGGPQSSFVLTGGKEDTGLIGHRGGGREKKLPPDWRKRSKKNSPERKKVITLVHQRGEKEKRGFSPPPLGVEKREWPKFCGFWWEREKAQRNRTEFCNGGRKGKKKTPLIVEFFTRNREKNEPPGKRRIVEIRVLRGSSKKRPRTAISPSSS